jgi:hypothetical protein
MISGPAGVIAWGEGECASFMRRVQGRELGENHRILNDINKNSIRDRGQGKRGERQGFGALRQKNHQAVRVFRTFPRSELISGIKKAPAISDRGS